MLSEMLDKALSALSAALVTHVRANKSSLRHTNLRNGTIKCPTNLAHGMGVGVARVRTYAAADPVLTRVSTDGFVRECTPLPLMGAHSSMQRLPCVCVCVCAWWTAKKKLPREVSFSLWKCRAHGDQWARGGGGLILRVGGDGDAWEANLGAAVLRHPRERP